MSKFSFRQRAGNIDWKTVSSVKIDEVIVKCDTKPLQNVLDAVTFCVFRPDDVKHNSIESVAKFVSILQLISEYLLHCQEAQFKVIRDLQCNGDKHKRTIDNMREDVLSLKEDRKIYQRQLAMLRKSLGPDYFLNNNANSAPVPPKVVQLLSQPEEVAVPKGPEVAINKPLDAEIIASILRHEGETRRFMSTLLNDQRGMFMEQINTITESLKEFQQRPPTKENVPPESESNAAMMNKLQAQMEATVKRAIESMEQTVSKAMTAMAQEQKKAAAMVPARAPSPQPLPASASKRDTEIALQTAALEQFEKELEDREHALQRKEAELNMKAEMARGTAELTVAARRASDTERLDLLTANEAMSLNALTVAARVIGSTIKHALFKKKLKAWRRWGAVVSNLRDIETSNQQAKLLVYAKEQRTLRESELQSQLDLEKERAAVSQAKQHSLLRALDAAETKVSELSAGSGQLGIRESDLQHMLQLEREKVTVASAKYNTLKTKSDREVQELREKVHELEEVLSNQRFEPTSKVSRDTSVMTSMEHASSSLSASLGPVAGSLAISTPTSRHHSGHTFPAPAATLHLRQSLQRQYISSDASEQDLFARVQRKMAHRRTPEEIEAEAMSSLALEINARMVSQHALEI